MPKKSNRQAPSTTTQPNLTLPLAIHTQTPKPRRDIVSEFDTYFGNATSLQNWQRLCHDVGLEDDKPSIRQCRQALKSVWVNIYDLLDARAAGVFPRHFENQQALARYTIDKRKIYPKSKAKKGGPVRALLVHIF